MGNMLGRGWCCRRWVCHSPDGFHYCCNPLLHEETGQNGRLADFVGVVILLLARGHGDGTSLVYEASTCLQMGKFFLEPRMHRILEPGKIDSAATSLVRRQQWLRTLVFINHGNRVQLGNASCILQLALFYFKAAGYTRKEIPAMP